MKAALLNTKQRGVNQSLFLAYTFMFTGYHQYREGYDRLHFAKTSWGNVGCVYACTRLIRRKSVADQRLIYSRLCDSLDSRAQYAMHTMHLSDTMLVQYLRRERYTFVPVLICHYPGTMQTWYQAKLILYMCIVNKVEDQKLFSIAYLEISNV